MKSKYKCNECSRKCRIEISKINTYKPEKCPWDTLGFSTGYERWQEVIPKKKKKTIMVFKKNK